MLETSQERVVLLKAGFKGKEIETLYLLYNGFTLVGSPSFFKPADINEENKNTAINQEAAPELSL
jgi:hypothetical protein